MPKSDLSLVSIGIPVYNGQRFLRRAIDSLLFQDYKNIEVIISDNASTDKTFQICKEYAERDARILLNRNANNIGAINNFRLVLEKAKGKYFMWAAADDYWHPEFVSSLLKELDAHPESGVAMCAFERIWDDASVFDTIRFDGEDNPNHRSYYQMLKGLTSGRKYNLYIYGLFNTRILKGAMKTCFDVPGWDRIFICQLALATPFRYVAHILYKKTIYVQPYNVRWPGEKFSKILNDKIISDMKITFALARTILQSGIIPWYRKSYLPSALWRYALLLLLSRFVPKIKELLSPAIWRQVKKLKKIILTDV